MEAEAKFLRLFKPVALGDRIDGWRVCWIGGWTNAGSFLSGWSRENGPTNGDGEAVRCTIKPWSRLRPALTSLCCGAPQTAL